MRGVRPVSHSNSGVTEIRGSDINVVYYSRMFQAVPHLAQVCHELPGTFVTSRKSTLKAAKNLYPFMPSLRTSKFFGGFNHGNRTLKNADVIVTGSPYKSVLAPFSAKKCTVFHGTYMMLSREALLSNAHFDLLCVTGPRMQQMIDRHANEIPVNAVQTGFLPFVEFPVKSEHFTRKTLEALNLNPEYKTILYTPSRRGIGSWDYVAEQLILTLPKCFNLILRPHPSQAITPRKKDKLSFNKVKKMAVSRGNTIVDLTSLPLPHLQCIADLIISDANSPAEESLFYDAPQLFIETENYSRDTVKSIAVKECMHKDDLEKLLTLYEIGESIYLKDSTFDFADLVSSTLLNSEIFSAKREEYFSWVFGVRDRYAGKRVADSVFNLLVSS